MSEIEWQETRELRPSEWSVAHFCARQGIDPTGLPEDGLLAFIEDEALESLVQFLSDETTREHGGVLVGEPFRDPARGQYFVVINRAIPAFGTEGSPVHMQFTPESWDYIAGMITDELPGKSVVGWQHSHPALGVFMSATDRATQAAFFDHPWSVAVVVDPIAQKSGWFAGKDCARMRPEQVVVFSSRAAPKRPAGPSRPPRSERLGWLLPGGLMLLCAALAAWFWLRARLQAGMA